MSPEDRVRELGIELPVVPAIAEVWGDDHGPAARSAIGVAELPGGMAVEVEIIVAPA